MAGQGRFPKGDKSEESRVHAEKMRIIRDNERENERLRDSMRKKG